MVLKSWDKHKENFSDVRIKFSKLGKLRISLAVKSQKTQVCFASLSQQSISFLSTGTTPNLPMVLLSGAHVKLIGGGDGINALVLPSSRCSRNHPNDVSLFLRGASNNASNSIDSL